MKANKTYPCDDGRLPPPSLANAASPPGNPHTAMRQPIDNYHEMSSLKYLEQKESEEYRQVIQARQDRNRERMVFLGYLVIAVLSTLLISGAMNFDQWRPLFD